MRPSSSAGRALRASEGPHTWDDFIALPDDDDRELIDGELVEGEVTTLKHEHAVAALAGSLVNYSHTHGGIVVASRYKVRIGPKRGVMPDVQYFRPDNVPGLEHNQGLARGRPDIAIEVISPSYRRYDRVVKLGYYLSIKVPEYWLVDPDAREVERLIHSPKGYVLAETCEGDAILKPPAFPGLEISLARVWLPDARKVPLKKAKPRGRRT
jgi:Uma2 family endonuclease